MRPPNGGAVLTSQTEGSRRAYTSTRPCNCAPSTMTNRGYPCAFSGPARRRLRDPGGVRLHRGRTGRLRRVARRPPPGSEPVNRRRRRLRVRARRRAAPGTAPPRTSSRCRNAASTSAAVAARNPPAASTSITNSPQPRPSTRQRRAPPEHSQPAMGAYRIPPSTPARRSALEKRVCRMHSIGSWKVCLTTARSCSTTTDGG